MERFVWHPKSANNVLIFVAASTPTIRLTNWLSNLISPESFLNCYCTFEQFLTPQFFIKWSIADTLTSEIAVVRETAFFEKIYGKPKKLLGSDKFGYRLKISNGRIFERYR